MRTENAYNDRDYWEYLLKAAKKLRLVDKPKEKKICLMKMLRGYCLFLMFLT